MRKVEIVDTINDLYSRVTSSRSDTGIFIEGDQIKTQNAQSQRYLQLCDDYPGSIAGVYNRSIAYDDFVADMMDFLRSMRWI